VEKEDSGENAHVVTDEHEEQVEYLVRQGILYPHPRTSLNRQMLT
jgi:hypothetical protein